VKLRLEYVLSFKNPATRQERIEDFDHLPKTLQEAYERLWARLRLDKSDEYEKCDILKAFAWILYSRRPLCVDELAEVLSVREGHLGLKQGRIMREEDILELCCGFVVVHSEGTLQFTHQTAQIFLQEHHLNDIRPRRHDIVMACLSYLQFSEFEKGEYVQDSLKTRYKALDYIAHHWGNHAKEEEHSPDVQRPVLAFLASERKRNWMLKAKRGGKFIPGQTLLQIVVEPENGLGTICRLVLQEHLNEDVKRYSLAISAY